jgi:hypothetical protein
LKNGNWNIQDILLAQSHLHESRMRLIATRAQWSMLIVIPDNLDVNPSLHGFEVPFNDLFSLMPTNGVDRKGTRTICKGILVGLRIHKGITSHMHPHSRCLRISRQITLITSEFAASGRRAGCQNVTTVAAAQKGLRGPLEYIRTRLGFGPMPGLLSPRQGLGVKYCPSTPRLSGRDMRPGSKWTALGTQ